MPWPTITLTKALIQEKKTKRQNYPSSFYTPNDQTERRFPPPRDSLISNASRTSRMFN